MTVLPKIVELQDVALHLNILDKPQGLTRYILNDTGLSYIVFNKA